MSGPIWYITAQRSLGVREIPGARHSKAILGWLQRLKSWFTDDETPWCGTFVAQALDLVGLKPVKNWFRALAWKDYGTEVSPQLGAILVFVRSGGGHVGFYAGEDDTRYYVLGGNQGNAVSYAWIAKERLVACRWPAGVPVPNTGRVRLANNGAPSSVNEA